MTCHFCIESKFKLIQPFGTSMKIRNEKYKLFQELRFSDKLE